MFRGEAMLLAGPVPPVGLLLGSRRWHLRLRRSLLRRLSLLRLLAIFLSRHQDGMHGIAFHPRREFHHRFFAQFADQPVELGVGGKIVDRRDLAELPHCIRVRSFAAKFTPRASASRSSDESATVYQTVSPWLVPRNNVSVATL